ncbi:transcriptional regulator FilR1 domain-containing protein [Halorubrum amylolyticum]|uniref:transcriptional regulator FilR1 domain-containing protein n=1 Tax=Halorubrum amylolyticum TaxID=2508724 RepID=UPI00100877F5|nr:hypothetical protein [Halorubrum amylolyticum]
MADGDTPGAVLRGLVAEAVGVEGDDTGAIAADLAERGDDPGPAAELSSLVGAGDAVVGIVTRADPALARRLLESGDDDRGVSTGGGDDESAGGGDDESAGGGDNEGTGSADGGTVRLVFAGRAADRLVGPSGTVIRSILAEHGIDAYRYEGDAPIGVLLVDDRAVVGLFDERGLAALLWSDAPAIREWAAATCRRYLSAADPV